MLLEKLNRGLRAFAISIEIAQVSSRNPPLKERLIEVHRDKHGLCSITVAMSNGRFATFKQLAVRDSTEWVEIFPDPFTNEPVYQESAPSYHILGFIPSHID